jgi:hypothetical protein
MPMSTSSLQVSLPVQRAERVRGERFGVTAEVLGSCFSIGGGFFLTAGHVVREASAVVGAKVPVVGVPDPSGGFVGLAVEEGEDLGADVGVLRVAYAHSDYKDWFLTFPWRQSPLAQLEEAKTVGYAFGHTDVDGVLQIGPRAFQGYVVARRNRFKPPGMSGPAFSVYELSFAAPTGLSGAPLFGPDMPSRIVGLVVGNTETEMCVYRSSETLSDGATVESVSREEMLRLGIAVEVGTLLTLGSSLLGGALADHLRKHALLPSSQGS